ncbi:hypothetical protein ACIPEQ_05370 [Curtobacterium sp. NPDC087080]|uniref:hypothetical protein n=1 Tax=Curtobacterium sp. NPDC087080 TaxID=3363965 RepID=UPI00382F2172
MLIRPRRRSRLHRVRTVFLALLAAGALVLTGSVTWRLAGPYPSGSWASLDDTDRTMFRQLSEEFERARQDPAGMWTEDYHYEEQPFVLLRTSGPWKLDWSYAYLVNMSDRTDVSGMRRVELPGMPLLDDVRVSKRFAFSEPWLHVKSQFGNIEVGGHRVLAFKFHPGMFGDDVPTNADFRHFAAHEHFHVAVQGIEPGDPGYWDYDDGGRLDVPASPEHRRLLRAEMAAFTAATGTDDPTAVSRAATDAARLRLARYERWPELRQQDGIETVEGTATYFETAVNDDAATSDAPTLLDVFDEYADELVDRDLYYSSGLAVGWVLDVLAPGWRVELSERAPTDHPTLFDLLTDALGGRPDVPSAAECDELVARYT